MNKLSSGENQPGRNVRKYLDFRDLVRQNKELTTIVLIILATGLVLLPLFRYQINPDATSYIKIAEKYASGDFKNAINGYWGPLLSWMIVPSFWLNINPLLWVKTLQILLVGVLIVTTYIISLRNKITDKKGVLLVCGVLGIIGLSWALPNPITPDLLVVVLVGILLLLILEYKKMQSLTKLGIALISFAGVLLYFAKTAGLFIYLGTISCLILYSWLANKNSFKQKFALIKPWLFALVLPLVLILPFVGAISYKYRHPTIGTSGQYNFYLTGPNTIGHPMLTQGLISPQNSTAISVWEDISFAKVREWSPLESHASFLHFTGNIRNNVLRIYQYTIVPLLMIAPLVLLYLSIREPKKSHENFTKTMLLLTALIVASIYTSVLVEDRYLWTIQFILLLAFGGVWKLYKEQRLVRLFLYLSLIIVLIAPIQQLYSNRHVGKDILAQSQPINTILNSETRIASDTFDSIYVCYYTGAKCYGVLALTNQPLTKQQILDYRITHVLISDDSAKTLEEMGIALYELPYKYFDAQLYRVGNIKI